MADGVSEDVRASRGPLAVIGLSLTLLVAPCVAGEPNCGEGDAYAGGSSSGGATPLAAEPKPPAGRKFTRIFRSWMDDFAVFSTLDQIVATFEASPFSIRTDWTRNLSRHLASRGGSSFIAWSKTAECQLSGNLATKVCVTLNFHRAVWLYDTRVGPDTVPAICQRRTHDVERVHSHCLGAVVLTYDVRAVSVGSLAADLTRVRFLTLKAAAVVCGLLNLNVSETSWLKGPTWRCEPRHLVFSIQGVLTSEAQLLRV